MKAILVEERNFNSSMDNKEASTPILVDNLHDLSVRDELIHRYEENGFVIFEVSNETPSSELIINLAKALHLGDTYVTGYNKSNFGNMFNENSLNAITSTPKSNHVVFNTTNAQGLHSDGTFEPIGKVPTTILYCEQEAFQGGDTILFDSVRAFKLLEAFNPEWAKAMLHPEALRRHSSYDDGVAVVEPAFQVLYNGEIVSRFSVDTTSDWEYGFERVPYLREAFGFMAGLILRGSGFSTILKLKSNQGILFANDKIAHGRTAFTDDKKAPRKMIRGLYLNRPSLTE